MAANLTKTFISQSISQNSTHTLTMGTESGTLSAAAKPNRGFQNFGDSFDKNLMLQLSGMRYLCCHLQE